MKTVRTDYAELRAALAMGPTPGPWEVINGSDVFTGLGARNAAGVEAVSYDGWHIADCDMGPSSTVEGEADIPHAEKLANARLIAAANPETIRTLLDEMDTLREALEMMVEMVEMNGFGRNYVMDVARTALGQEQEEI